ncbi:ankyrin repeat and SOCS box protein 9-like isoform 2-T2 [Menidia menidia]
MSDQRLDAQPDGAGQSGAVFFSNPLMSDVESDWSPVHDAAFNGRVLNLQRLIAQGACVNLNTLDQVSPLHGACVQGHTACAKLLLESGANVNSSTLDGQTALSEACARGNLTCVSLLLQHGASPLGAGRSNPPLHSAAAEGHPECVEALVRHGADVDQHVEHLGSPLHVACSNRRLDTVRKLLQLGARVDGRVSGDSPLHVAARLSSPELVSVLLEHGADRLLLNSEGKRPLDLAPPDSPAGGLLKKAGGVSPLKQLCRLDVRRAVGRRRLGGLPDLDLPAELIGYLLHQSDPGGN